MPPFWKTKTLEQMTRAEWESLCDGCGRCCLHKLRDDDTEAIAWTNVACRLLDTATCQCSDYADRRRRVPDCVQLTPPRWPTSTGCRPSCAYRRVREGRGPGLVALRWSRATRRRCTAAGVSVRGRVVDERVAGDLEGHVTDWPGRLPRKRFGVG